MEFGYIFFEEQIYVFSPKKKNINAITITEAEWDSLKKEQTKQKKKTNSDCEKEDEPGWETKLVDCEREGPC